jgi:hypothetical protein
MDQLVYIFKNMRIIDMIIKNDDWPIHRTDVSIIVRQSNVSYPYLNRKNDLKNMKPTEEMIWMCNDTEQDEWKWRWSSKPLLSALSLCGRFIDSDRFTVTLYKSHISAAQEIFKSETDPFEYCRVHARENRW